MGLKRMDLEKNDSWQEIYFVYTATVQLGFLFLRQYTSAPSPSLPWIPLSTKIPSSPLSSSAISWNHLLTACHWKWRDAQRYSKIIYIYPPDRLKLWRESDCLDEDDSHYLQIENVAKSDYILCSRYAGLSWCFYEYYHLSQTQMSIKEMGKCHNKMLNWSL